MREGTTSRVTAADRPYFEFYEFYSVSAENFGSTLVFTSKFVGTGPWSYENRIYWAKVSQRLRNTGLRRAFTPLGCWDYRVESRRGHGYLSLVNFVCCEVEVSVTVRSPVQRTPTECVCVCVCVCHGV